MACDAAGDDGFDDDDGDDDGDGDVDGDDGDYGFGDDA